MAASGMRTPPSGEMGTVEEEEILEVGGEYWMQDEKGDDVWTVVEVMEQCGGHVILKVSESGERKEIDLVSTAMPAIHRGHLCFLIMCAKLCLAIARPLERVRTSSSRAMNLR